MESPMYHHALELAKTLSGKEQLRLVAELVQDLIADEGLVEAPKKPFQSVRGTLKGLGPSPSPEDFDEARRAMWEHLAPEEASR
jgi:hypothetical protein